MNLDTEGIVKLINDYDRDSKAIKQELLKMSWFMRGGLSYDQAHLLTPDERLIISKIIEEHLETTKESGLPFF